jgi:hypothetical protein
VALDTKQKQGSALDIGMPFRQWLAEPVAVLTSAEHLSLLKLCSEPVPGVVVLATGRIRTAWTVRQPSIVFSTDEE